MNKIVVSRFALACIAAVLVLGVRADAGAADTAAVVTMSPAAQAIPQSGTACVDVRVAETSGAPIVGASPTVTFSKTPLEHPLVRVGDLPRTDANGDARLCYTLPPPAPRKAPESGEWDFAVNSVTMANGSSLPASSTTALVLVTHAGEQALSVIFTGGGHGKLVVTAGQVPGGPPVTFACDRSCVRALPMFGGLPLTLTLQAVASGDSTFAGWTGRCATSSGTFHTCWLPPEGNGDATVGVAFARQAVTLTLTVGGSGRGSIVSEPSGIDCGQTCSAAFPWSSLVTLRALPAPGSAFSGWTGACVSSGSSPQCTIPMSAASTVGATFVQLTVRLSVQLAGRGRGTVVSDPAGIDCGETCAASFPAASNVALRAVPAVGSAFAGWTGACATAATSPECSVTMTDASTVAASFEPATSKAQPRCRVPRVIGQVLATARRALVAAHCGLGSISRKPSRTVKPGRIIAQAPAAGAVRKEGAKVNVVVSVKRGKRGS